MKITKLHKSCVAGFFSCLCLAPAAFADGVRTAIEAANARFVATAAKGDGAGLAALYSKEGQVMPAGSDPIQGTDAIQKFWQGALDSGITGVTLKTIDVYGNGPTATEVGQYELSSKAGKVVDHGLAACKRQVAAASRYVLNERGACEAVVSFRPKG